MPVLTVFMGGNHEASAYLQVCDGVGSEGFGRLVGDLLCVRAEACRHRCLGRRGQCCCCCSLLLTYAGCRLLDLRGYFLLTPRLLPSSVVIDIASVSSADKQRYVPSAATTTKLQQASRR